MPPVICVYFLVTILFFYFVSMIESDFYTLGFSTIEVFIVH